MKFALLLLCILCFPIQGMAADTIRIAYPSTSFTTVPIVAAIKHGHFKQEGIRAELIFMRPNISITALVNGQVEFATVHGSVVRAAARGLPVKSLMVIADRPAYFLVTKAMVKSIPALKGKTIGIASLGGSVHLMTKELFAQSGLDPDRDVSMVVTGDHNTSILAMQMINNVLPSCGCTVAQMPTTPWKLTPGASGPIVATINFAGKTGDLSKTMTVISSVGQQTLTMRVHIPRDEDVERRQRNMLIALQDRQSVFRNDCANCHVKNGEGKKGAELFAADCAICHDPPPPGHRAEIVTDLKKINHPTDEAFWRSIITSGKDNSLMPAFAKAKGGPLDDEQIESLVEYCMKAFPNRFSATTKDGAAVKPAATKPAGGTQ